MQVQVRVQLRKDTGAGTGADTGAGTGTVVGYSYRQNPAAPPINLVQRLILMSDRAAVSLSFSCVQYCTVLRCLYSRQGLRVTDKIYSTGMIDGGGGGDRHTRLEGNVGVYCYCVLCTVYCAAKGKGLIG